MPTLAVTARPGLRVCADERRGRAARSAALVRRWSGSSPDSTSLYLQAMDAMHQARALGRYIYSLGWHWRALQQFDYSEMTASQFSYACTMRAPRAQLCGARARRALGARTCLSQQCWTLGCRHIHLYRADMLCTAPSCVCFTSFTTWSDTCEHACCCASATASRRAAGEPVDALPDRERRRPGRPERRRVLGRRLHHRRVRRPRAARHHWTLRPPSAACS